MSAGVQLTTTFKKGKYAGCSLQQVIKTDPSYIRFLIQKVNFRISAEAHNLLGI